MMRVLVALYVLLFAAAVSAEELAPDAQIKKIADEVVALAKQDKGIDAGNPDKLYALIDAKVLPHFHFSRMAALALGRNWPKANAEQQAALTSEFRTLLVRTYSSALSMYKHHAIEVKPLRASAGAADVTVRTRLRLPGSAPVSIDYSMEQTPGGWKVYDVAIGGVSLVSNYRESFNAAIRGGGVDGLIKTLADKNRPRELDAGARSG